jgi:hypothetical protein
LELAELFWIVSIFFEFAASAWKPCRIRVDTGFAIGGAIVATAEVYCCGPEGKKGCKERREMTPHMKISLCSEAVS